MKIRTIAVAALAAATLVAANAAAETAEHACRKETAALKGEAHDKAFEKCLKEHAAAGNHVARASTPAQERQHNRMKACNEEAAGKSLKGDERRAFMSHCLKEKD